MSSPDPARSALEQTVREAQAGGAAAFEWLIGEFNPRITYYLGRLLRDTDRAEDAAQETWVNVWRELKKLREPAAFTVWLYRIARRQALRELRRRKQFELLHPARLEDAEDPASEPDSRFDAEDAAEIHAALDRINPQQREVLSLRFMEELDYGAMAEVIGVSIGTIRSRLHYGKLALKEELQAIRKEPR